MRRWWRARGLRLTVESAALSALVLAVVAWIYRIWEASLRTPFYQRHDARLVQMYVRNTLEHGWWDRNPDLGAPFGLGYLDLPHGGEHLQFAVIKVLGAVLGNDVGLTVNAYYLLGFALTAVVAHLVLRHLGFSWPVAGLVAVAFTFLPFHFAHHQQHLWRSVYPNVPLFALLMLWAVTPRHSFLVDPDAVDDRGRTRIRGNLRRGRLVAAVLLAVVIGSWETMMIAFGCSVLAAFGAIVAIRRRDWAPLAASFAAAAGVVVVFVVQTLPSFIHWAVDGPNGQAARRLATESEYYGLKLSRVLLPEFNHRLPQFAEWGRVPLDTSPIPSESGQSIGVIGAIGLLAAIVVVLGWGLVRRARPVEDREQLLGLSGIAVVLSILFGTVSGLAVILSMAGFSQIRVWNRIVVLLAFFVFVVVAIGLERLGAWLRPRRRGPALAALGLVVLLAFNLWDTARVTRPDYDGIVADTQQLRGFVEQIEQQLGAGAAVFQYPIIPFPEHPPVEGMVDYDHLAPYLQGTSLRWSYGAVKGRDEADWQITVRELPTQHQLGVLAGMGFEGIWIDRAGFADYGQGLVDHLTVLTRTQPAESGRYVFFDLRPWIDSTGLSPATFRAAAEIATGITPPEP